MNILTSEQCYDRGFVRIGECIEALFVMPMIDGSPIGRFEHEIKSTEQTEECTLYANIYPDNYCLVVIDGVEEPIIPKDFNDIITPFLQECAVEFLTVYAFQSHYVPGGAICFEFRGQLVYSTTEGNHTLELKNFEPKCCI